MHIDLIICIKNDKIYVDRITKLGTARNKSIIENDFGECPKNQGVRL